MRADAESSCTESRTDSWSQDGARNPWSAPTTELWAPTGRIEEYLPEAEATLTLSLRGRGHDPAAAAAGAAADRMLAGLRHLADASRTYAATLDDPDVDGSAAERELHTARADAFASLRALIEGAS